MKFKSPTIEQMKPSVFLVPTIRRRTTASFFFSIAIKLNYFGCKCGLQRINSWLYILQEEDSEKDFLNIGGDVYMEFQEEFDYVSIIEYLEILKFIAIGLHIS